MDVSTVENKASRTNMDNIPEDLVFGLDIGTRNIVGTVGYRDRDGHFVVVAQASEQHVTRAMLDGQIHDIGKVADNIKKVHDRLEDLTGRKLKNVCIAAAGRVLQTIEEEAEVNFNTETVVTSEHVYSLDMLAVEKAHERLKELDQSDLKFFCVGYSVMHYYQNDYPISNLEGHKCSSIRTELIATFLPEEVVDGLYAAVERAGLYVENLTLEPIAAINIAIPERFRLLNIALVDVGAGTSDISITKDGSIIAYGMIPCAGDEMTETIAKHYLVDFQEADRLKCESTNNDQVEFHDIMGLPQQATSEEIADVVSETVQTITKDIADKIIELNGGKSVSAVFVVGGGGKMRGFTESLAEYLELRNDRVALRGTEVLSDVTFLQQDLEVDSLLVTPVGICLNYYEQRNNFVFVNINDERIKLYDNGKLTILDAALQVGIPNEVLFPQRGDALTFTINGEKRMQRGEPGESARIRLNDRDAGISTPINQNDTIEVTPSTKGIAGALTVGSLPEFKSTISYYVNDKKVVCPCFVLVNDELVSEYYEIKDGDRIQVLDYYTLEQVLEFMDVSVSGEIFVNNMPAKSDTRVYENFTVRCDIPEQEAAKQGNSQNGSSGQDGDKPEINNTPNGNEDKTVPQNVSGENENKSEAQNPFDGKSEENKASTQNGGESSGGGMSGANMNVADKTEPDHKEKHDSNENSGQSPLDRTPSDQRKTQMASLYPSAMPAWQKASETNSNTTGQSQGVGGQVNASQTSPWQSSQSNTSQSSQMQTGGQSQPMHDGQNSSAQAMSDQQDSSAQKTSGQQNGLQTPNGQQSQESQQSVTSQQNTQGQQNTPQNAQGDAGQMNNTSQGVDGQANTPQGGGEQMMPDSLFSEEDSGKVPPLMPRVQRNTQQQPVNAKNMIVTVNGESVVLKGKEQYILVDVLDVYPIDTAVAHGDRMETKVNGVDCDFSHPLRSGDNVIVRWVED
ncbi:MAG: rod shape-determining protein [Lachnospiraceae bacterium]|nr:rod shape-determining protein [Lachnospiraceae bacterium]